MQKLGIAWEGEHQHHYQRTLGALHGPYHRPGDVRWPPHLLFEKGQTMALHVFQGIALRLLMFACFLLGVWYVSYPSATPQKSQRRCTGYLRIPPPSPPGIILELDWLDCTSGFLGHAKKETGCFGPTTQRITY